MNIHSDTDTTQHCSITLTVNISYVLRFAEIRSSYKVNLHQCNEITQDFVEEFFYNAKQIMGEFDGAKICQIAHICKSGKLPLS